MDLCIHLFVGDIFYPRNSKTSPDLPLSRKSVSISERYCIYEVKETLFNFNLEVNLQQIAIIKGFEHLIFNYIPVKLNRIFEVLIFFKSSLIVFYYYFFFTKEKTWTKLPQKDLNPPLYSPWTVFMVEVFQVKLGTRPSKACSLWYVPAPLQGCSTVQLSK